MINLLPRVIEQIVMGITGAAVTGLGVITAFYVKRLTDEIKRKGLIEEIHRYVLWAEQYPSFQEYTGEQKFNAVMGRAMSYAREHNIFASEEELTIIVESAVKQMKIGENNG